MSGNLEELLVHDVRRVDEIVAVPEDELALEVLDLASNHSAVRMPENEPCTDTRIRREEIELAAERAMIATLGLLEAMQIGGEIFLVPPRRAVDALQHLPMLIATPVRACRVQELEVLDARRVWHVRAAAQIDERSVRVRRNHFVFAELGESLELERIVDEFRLRALAIDLLAHERKFFVRSAAHLLLDLLEIVGGERLGDLEVVVEAILDRGAESDRRPWDAAGARPSRASAQPNGGAHRGSAHLFP